MALAIPVNNVISIIDALKAGELAPERSNEDQDRIDVLEREVSEVLAPHVLSGS